MLLLLLLLLLLLTMKIVLLIYADKQDEHQLASPNSFRAMALYTTYYQGHDGHGHETPRIW